MKKSANKLKVIKNEIQKLLPEGPKSSKKSTESSGPRKLRDRAQETEKPKAEKDPGQKVEKVDVSGDKNDATKN